MVTSVGALVFGEKFVMKLVRMKIVVAGLLFALLVPALADAEPPPHLRWQNNNCWLLGVVYVLWSMLQLTDYVIGKAKNFPRNRFESAYAKLAMAIKEGYGNKSDSWGPELRMLQNAAAVDFGTSRDRFEESGDFFGVDRLGNIKEKKTAITDYLYELLDLAGGARQSLFQVQTPHLSFLGKGIFGFPPDTPKEFRFVPEDLSLRQGVKHPQYLMVYLSEKGFDWGKISIPLAFDNAPYIDPREGGFETCEYELAVVVVRQGENHFVSYVRDFDDNSWYLCDDFPGKTSPHAPKKVPLPENNTGLWRKGFCPQLVLYRRTKLIPKKKDLLQEKLEKLSGSLEKLAEQLKKK